MKIGADRESQTNKVELRRTCDLLLALDSSIIAVCARRSSALVRGSPEARSEEQGTLARSGRRANDTRRTDERTETRERPR